MVSHHECASCAAIQASALLLDAPSVHLCIPLLGKHLGQALTSCDKHIDIPAYNLQAEVGKRIMNPASGSATVTVDTTKTYDYELRSINKDGAFSKPFVVRALRRKICLALCVSCTAFQLPLCLCSPLALSLACQRCSVLGHVLRVCTHMLCCSCTIGASTLTSR